MLFGRFLWHPLTFENQVASYLEYASALCAYSELWSVEKIDQTAQLRVRNRIMLRIVVVYAKVTFPSGAFAIQRVQRATDEIWHPELNQL